MKDMHLAFDFQGKWGFNFVGGKDYTSSSSSSLDPNIFVEPTSVLDNISSPNPPCSSSTLSSSSLGGCGCGSTTTTATVAAVSGNPWPPTPQHEANVVGQESGLQQIPQISGDRNTELGMEDWESILSVSPTTQEQSVLGWIMRDAKDPSLGLNKVLQIGAADIDFNGGFDGIDQAFGGLVTLGTSTSQHFIPTISNSCFPQKLAPNPLPYKFGAEAGSVSLNQTQQTPLGSSEMKPQIYNPQMLINQHQAQQTQNPAFFLPMAYNSQQDQHLYVPPHSKRHNPGNLESTSPILKGPFLDSGQELYSGRNQQHHSFPGVPNYPQQIVARPKLVGDELGQQQVIIDQLYKASELLLLGNVIHLQEILARLNHQLSPIGKPFHRSAYYCKEAIQLLLQTNNRMNPSSTSNSPFNLIYKIGAYKSFSEISPVLQFTNFTCNQALLEAIDGFDQIHIIDFDIGYGGQWASLMQELALKNGGIPSLKITAFASPSNAHDQLELGLTRENLNHFASEISMAFQFEIVSLDALDSTSWSLPIHVLESEAVAVNLPAGSFFNHQVSLPLVLRFIKQLSPKIVVSADRGCDRTDLPFPNHVIHVMQSYTNLLESLDAVNLNDDALHKIERFLLQPGIEKIVMGRYRSPEKSQHWRTLFLSSGFSPLSFSNFSESQAECVVKRTLVRGFHVEKRQSSLVLYWQRRELISVSAWRC